MSESATAIMDSAERRMRVGGFAGFSFREIAAEVGVKSSSVHYHFPTKEKLAAAVVRRYMEVVGDQLDWEMAKDPDTVAVWTRVFRDTLHSKGRMCPVTVLGATALDLPTEVAAEVKNFYGMSVDKLAGGGLSEEAAAEFLATLTGALVVAIARDDISFYDRATSKFSRRSEPVAV